MPLSLIKKEPIIQKKRPDAMQVESKINKNNKHFKNKKQ